MAGVDIIPNRIFDLPSGCVRIVYTLSIPLFPCIRNFFFMLYTYKNHLHAIYPLVIYVQFPRNWIHLQISLIYIIYSLILDTFIYKISVGNTKWIRWSCTNFVFCKTSLSVRLLKRIRRSDFFSQIVFRATLFSSPLFFFLGGGRGGKGSGVKNYKWQT